MKHPKLSVTKREITGKKVKHLRRDGLLPANMYGKELKSTAVQVPYKEFDPIYKEVKETGLVDIDLDGKTTPVLIKNVFKNPLTHQILHVDFFQVNLKEKITSMVPVVLTGDAAAVTEKVGLVMQPLSEIEVEALPENLPENIDVNIAPLAAVGDQITVGDLKAPPGVTLVTDPGQVVVKIAELVSEEAAADAAAAEAASEEAKEGEETPGAEGEAKEGEKTEEKTEEKQEQKEE